MRWLSKESVAASIIVVVALAAPADAPLDAAHLLHRAVRAALALAALLAASVALDLYHGTSPSAGGRSDASAQSSAPSKAKKRSTATASAAASKNPFEISVTKVDLPTEPPGSIYEAALAMREHLKGFAPTRASDIKTTEQGFQISHGNQRLIARVVPGNAVGWEQGGLEWERGRQRWLSAAWAAPRAAEALGAEWMGLGAAGGGAAAPPADATADGAELSPGELVRITGVQSKPELNGRVGSVCKAANRETGRFGVRIEASKEPLSLHGRNLIIIDPLDVTGISLAGLRSFRRAFAAILDEPGLTMDKAAYALVQPLTAPARTSLARALLAGGAADEAARPMAAPATILVAASPTESLATALDAVEAYVTAADEPEAAYVWLPLLSLSQHASTPVEERPVAWWSGVFASAVKRVGEVALLMQPAIEPSLLARPFGMYHLYLAVDAGVRLRVMCAPADVEALRASLVEDIDGVIAAWDRLVESDWRKPDAPGATDAQRLAIERLIDKFDDGGAEGFFGSLVASLHKWLLSHARKALDALDADERGASGLLAGVIKILQAHGDVESAEPLAREQVAGRRARHGDRHQETLDAIANLSIILHQLGKLDEAEPYSREKLEGYRELHGEYHPDTVTALDTHSQLLSDMRKLEEALPLKREALAVKRKLLGNRHPDTLLSVNNLAVVLNDLGQQVGSTAMLREAEPLKREALQGCREVLGNRHPNTLASIANLADMLIQLGHVDERALVEAEPLCREAVAGSREVLGDGHPDTLKAVGNLAALLVEMARTHPAGSGAARARLEEAEPLFGEVQAGFTRGLGSTHASTLAYCSERARTLVELERCAEAEELLHDSIGACRAALGDGHPETLVALAHLAGVLRAQDKHGEAQAIMEEVIGGWGAIEADEPVKRHTVTSTNILAELLHAQGKHAEAEPLCRSVLADFVKAVGRKHPFTRSAAANLASVIKAMGGDDKAAEAEALRAEFQLDKEGEGGGEEGGGERV